MTCDASFLLNVSFSFIAFQSYYVKHLHCITFVTVVSSPAWVTPIVTQTTDDVTSNTSVVALV